MGPLVCSTRIACARATRRNLWSTAVPFMRSSRRRASSSSNTTGVVDGDGEHSNGIPRLPSSLPTARNRVTGCLEALPDPAAGALKWYSCGPTVYDSAHLGHARTYVSLDIVRRILVDYFHFDVIYALGITDVDDKIIARAGARGLTDWPEIAGMATEYEREFMKDMDNLGVRRPDAVTRVTDHLPDIIAYIERILENGMAYATDGGIYFDVEGMGDSYGKLGIGAADSTTPNQEQAVGDGGGGSPDLRGKRSHKDFALWKRAKPDEPWWDSPFGRGRPGWHIECSAMTHSLFGKHLDMHSGGIDLKFPHHTNEIAQCEAYGCGADVITAQGEGAMGAGTHKGKIPWVRHWLHTGHLHIEGLKMSKSLKNFVTVEEYLDAHADGRAAAAEDFRMFCLMHKYSSSVTFSEDRMEEARVVRGRMERFLALADSTLGAAGNKSVDAPQRWGDKEKWLVGKTSSCRREVHLALRDDFDTPRAIRHLASLCAVASRHLNDGKMADLEPVRSAAKYAADMLMLLGIGSSRAGATGGLAADAGGGEGGGGGGRWQDGEEMASTGTLPPAREVVEAMVEFRRAARHIVLGANLKQRENKNRMAAVMQMKRELLELVDHARDVTLRNLGVHVEDRAGNECVWMLQRPPSPGKAPPTSETEQLGSPSSVDRAGLGANRSTSSGGGTTEVPPWLHGLPEQADDMK